MGRVESLRTENKLKKTEIGEIPVDWEALNLDNISKEIYRYPTYFNIEYVKEGIPEVRGELIRPDGKLEKNLSKYRFISSKTALKFPRTCLKEGDFVISVRGTLGKVAITPKFLDGANITANLIRVFPDRKKIYPLFFHQILISEKFQKDLNNISSSTTIKTIKAPELKRLKFAIPSLPEQKKIAEILTLTDEAIEKKQEIIEKTKMLKKGLMQELLTHGIGHNKFKKTEIGEIPVDWEIYSLGDYAYIKARIGWRGLSASEYTDEGPLLIAGNHIKRTKILWDKCDHISQYRYDESPEIKLRNGDIILSKDGTIGRLGFIERLPQEATIGGTMMMIRPDENLFSSKFVYFYFQGEYFQKLIKEKISGSSIPHIFQRDIVNLKIPFLLLPEQRKIAEILTSVDEEIEKEMAYKERLEGIKKGLMQVLLTGKIRVKI